MQQHDKFRKELDQAQEDFDQRKFDRSIRGHGRILEMALRYVLKEIQHKKGVTQEDIGLINEAIGNVGKGQPLLKLGFGQMVGVYKNAKVEKMMKRVMTSDFKRTHRIDWDEAVQHRNKLVHDMIESDIEHSPGNEPDEEDAGEMCAWSKAFVYECGLVAKEDPTAPKPIPADSGASEETCLTCNEAQTEGWKFCPYCGTPGKRICVNASCDQELQPKWKRCPACEEPVVHIDSAETDRSRWEYHTMCRGAWADGIVNTLEREYLKERQLSLGLDNEAAEEIEKKAAPDHYIAYMHAVENFYVDGTISPMERVHLDRLAERLGIPEQATRGIEESCAPTSEVDESPISDPSPT